MFRNILLVITVAFICSTADASDAEWSWGFRAGSSILHVGTSPSAMDNFDANDRIIDSPRIFYVATYHADGVTGWAGDTGFYSRDVRAPLPLAPGESKTWTFYLWADSSVSGDWMELMWGYGGDGNPYPAFDKMEYRLAHVRAAEGITDGPAVGTSILLNEYGQGSWAVPMYRTEDGRTGYMFELTATVIPEPSSLAMVASGLLGLALRRRVRRKV